MVRQAKAYLAGAVGSVGLIAACVVVFVGLVALGASGKLPVLNSLGDNEPAAQRAIEPTGGLARSSSGGATSSGGADQSGSSGPSTAASDANAGGDPTQPLTGTAGEGGAPATSVPQGGSDAPRTPTAASGSPNRSSAARPVVKAPPASQAPPSRPGAELPGSRDLVDTVNDTVDQVDEALGGPLEKSGVGGAVKGATENVAGPDSTVGKTVDGLTGALGGRR